MKKLFLLSVIPCLLSVANCQVNYWQQQVNYTIDVSLNDKENTLDGYIRIEYANNSPDTLHFIWFHIWPNAYKNDKTAFSDQLLQNGNTAFYFSGKEKKGYINRLDFKVDNRTAETQDHPQYIDIIKLILPRPLPPAASVAISTPFHVKLPYNFSRGGYDGQHYYIAHWYPKPAVYDKNGWHPMPLLDQGEFYSEFGNYDVTITVPENYAVAATGELQNEEEKAWLKQRENFSWVPVKEKVTIKGATKTITKTFPESSQKTKTIRYLQHHVTDFAWFADKRFRVRHDTLLLQSGRVIDCYAYFIPGKNEYWNKSLSFIKNAVKTKSEWLGEYPYNTITVVQSTENSAAGTEYPTITILNAGDERMLEYIIRHEVGHNWLYGILASNERDFPWMDEGINSYYDHRYSQSHSRSGSIYAGSLGSLPVEEIEKILFQTKAKTRLDQPIALPSEKYNTVNYNLSVYYKAAKWMEYLQNILEKENFDAAMKAYFEKWKFKHPYPEDFKNIMEQYAGKNLDSAFQLLHTKGIIPGSTSGGTLFVNYLNPKGYGDHIRQPVSSLITYGPALGYNMYDKYMIGALFTNIKLPPSRFQFLMAPLYATGSKKISGLGKIKYSFYNDNSVIRKTDLFLNVSTFSNDEFTDDDGKKNILSFRKIVPGFRLTLRPKDPRDPVLKFFQFKSYFIKEDRLRFFNDTSINGTDTIITFRYRKEPEFVSLGQIKFVMENNRALYPYSAELNTEINKDFVRLAFTGHYFFNYSNGGGLSVRLFAGKFIYTREKTLSKQFETGRYHLNMTGPNGYEDYTYSDYFIGRNKFEKLPSQQIMMRDGGFKVRTDLLADKAGKTDEWLAAVNFSTTVPEKINPLTVLPVKIPLKVFFDIGTYAESWKRNSELDRFLINAGFQLSLFKEILNVYVPVLYSPVYRDYIRSVIVDKKLVRTISFSINISGLSSGKIDRNLVY